MGMGLSKHTTREIKCASKMGLYELQKPARKGLDTIGPRYSRSLPQKISTVFDFTQARGARGRRIGS